MKHHSSVRLNRGYPHPFGATLIEGGVNFALISAEAETVTLCLFYQKGENPCLEIPLDPDGNKTGDVWHILVQGLTEEMLYAYRIDSAFSKLHACSETFLMDPYAKSLGTGHAWCEGHSPYLPLGFLPQNQTFDWGHDLPLKIAREDLIIYEMHVRGFTQHPSSAVVHPGTFLGVVEKIPHLLELGVNAVELLPVQEFNEREYFLAHPTAKVPYCNFWGYSTVNFFSPMGRYATDSFPGTVVREFKTMVKELHRHGIEVILDIVFNHTAEGNAAGPILSYKALDCSTYYLLNSSDQYSNYSGCGNSLNANHPQVIEMIIDSLRYWTVEMHVDGFRFDLASELTRNSQGRPLSSAPLIQAITSDPLLANVKLIAEPWDAAGLYQVGHFDSSSSRWSEWNDKYRDAMRRFIKGTSGSKNEFATRLCGSEDLYKGRTPLSSLNFITAHDGFTLADLVSYTTKHNLDNNEKNQDGTNSNESWNCGIEGVTTDPEIIQLRERQMRNFHLVLMLSQGIPMLLMGDEYGHTKNGNNNSWCHDTVLNWFLWEELEKNQAFYRFYRSLIDFRKRHKILRRKTFLSPADITWHGSYPFEPSWDVNDLLLTFTFNDNVHHHDLYVAFNASHASRDCTIPPLPEKKKWHMMIDTAKESPHDFYEEASAPILSTLECTLIPHSAIVLKAL